MTEADREAHAVQVGRIALASAQLERAARGLLEVLDGGRYIRTIVAGQPWQFLQATGLAIVDDILEAGSLQRGPEIDEEARAALVAARDALSKAEGLMRLRGSVVHGHWYSTIDADGRRRVPDVTVKRQYQGREKVHRWPAGELGRLNDDLVDVYRAVGSAVVHVMRLDGLSPA